MIQFFFFFVNSQLTQLPHLKLPNETWPVRVLCESSLVEHVFTTLFLILLALLYVTNGSLLNVPLSFGSSFKTYQYFNKISLMLVVFGEYVGLE